MARARGLFLVTLLLVGLGWGGGPTVGRAQEASSEARGNNVVGINVARWTDPATLRATAALVNSSGGDWGYVTVLVMDEDRRDPARIQRVLDEAGRNRLIPIVRVGTSFDPARRVWRQPTPYDAHLWRVALAGLRWPTRLRYLLVGNEPNLGHEWGGLVDPPGYARYLDTWLHVFAHDGRYRIFNGALDASNDTLLPERMDMFEFMDGMRAAVPDVFERLHGWASSPYHFWWGAEDRYTFRAYEAELAYIGREMPVIVSEFHPQHIDDPLHVAGWYETAFAHWLADPRVLAATPMFWNPEQDRFWMYGVSPAGVATGLSPTYHHIRRLPKRAGSPDYEPPLGNVAREAAPPPADAGPAGASE
jgi:hypothetical protein